MTAIPPPSRGGDGKSRSAVGKAGSDRHRRPAGASPGGAGLDVARFLGVGRRDFALLEEHSPALASMAEPLARKFYAFLLSQPETRRAFAGLSPERLARLARRQAEHASGLLAGRLGPEWRDYAWGVGRMHEALGVAPLWVAGGYAIYWRHWQAAIGAVGTRRRRQQLRETAFKYLIGDLMLQLGGHAEAARETDAGRLAVFESFIQLVEDLALQNGGNRQSMLRQICERLWKADASVCFAGYLLAEAGGRVLLPGHFSGDFVPCAAPVRRSGDDPFWSTLRQRQSLICPVDAPELPAWLRAMAGDVAEIAVFPFGEGRGTRGLGLVGVRRAGHLRRIGPVYFKAFGQLTRLALRLYEQGLHDPLTGLPNRAFFAEAITFARVRAVRQGETLWVGILDLDGFKRVNDRLGHEAGDRLLRQVARRLRATLRGGDILARLGGDEFGLLISGPGVGEDAAIGERLLNALRRPFDLGEERVTISGSLGLSAFPHDPADAETLLRHADLAAYAAKARGKDQVCLHTRAVAAAVHRTDRAREMLVGALRSGRILMHYQPIVATGGEVLAAEALLRLVGPGGELIEPDQFAEALDHGRVARPLGRRALALAAAQAAVWHRAGIALPVAVNISPSHLLAPQFVEDLSEALDAQPDLPRGAVTLEVTESGPMQDLEQAESVFRACAALGVPFAIDDFGTGYTSLSYLRSLSPRMVKIDRSFVTSIRPEGREEAIVCGIVTIANRLDMRVIAEGIEIAAQARLMTGLGCHALQGFAIAPPMPPEQIPRWLRLQAQGADAGAFAQRLEASEEYA